MKIFYTIIIAFFVHFSYAQTIIWSEDFSNGIPLDWQNYDPTTNAVWDWSDNPNAIGVACEPRFQGFSANNGFAFFDSGAFGGAHDVRLKTPPINCASLSTVFIRFESQYTYFNAGNISKPQIGISTDGITFTYLPIFLDELPNVITDELTVEDIDISSLAAGEDSVYVEFRWEGNYEYSWELDDITIADGLTLPYDHDLVMKTRSIFPNYATPLAHTNPIQFRTIIENQGLQTQTNVKLIVEVVEISAGNAIRFRDSAMVASVSVAQEVELIVPNKFIPQDTGSYQLTYTITQDSADARRYNNIFTQDYIITQNLFSKDNDIGKTYKPFIGNKDYRMGNIYTVKDSGYTALQIAFEVDKFGTLAGNQVDILLYEVNSSVDSSFGNFDIFSDNDLTLVGSANYLFTVFDANYELITVDLLDFNTNQPGVLLKPNTRYFAILDFSGFSNDIDVVITDCIRYDYQLSTVVYFDGQWYKGGFGNDITAVVRLVTDQVISSNNKSLRLSEDLISIFPNPSSGLINIVSGKRLIGRESILQVYDVTGKLVHQQSILIESSTPLYLDFLSAGIYYISLVADNTTAKVPFLITK